MSGWRDIDEAGARPTSRRRSREERYRQEQAEREAVKRERERLERTVGAGIRSRLAGRGVRLERADR